MLYDIRLCTLHLDDEKNDEFIYIFHVCISVKRFENLEDMAVKENSSKMFSSLRLSWSVHMY